MRAARGSKARAPACVRRTRRCRWPRPAGGRSSPAPPRPRSMPWATAQPAAPAGAEPDPEPLQRRQCPGGDTAGGTRRRGRAGAADARASRPCCSRPSPPTPRSCRDRRVLELARGNEERLRLELAATRDRERFGDLTETDIHQAESRHEGGIADRVAAEGALAVAEADYCAGGRREARTSWRPLPCPNMPRSRSTPRWPRPRATGAGRRPPSTSTRRARPSPSRWRP